MQKKQQYRNISLIFSFIQFFMIFLFCSLCWKISANGMPIVRLNEKSYFFLLEDYLQNWKKKIYGNNILQYGNKFAFFKSFHDFSFQVFAFNLFSLLNKKFLTMHWDNYSHLVLFLLALQLNALNNLLNGWENVLFLVTFHEKNL